MAEQKKSQQESGLLKTLMHEKKQTAAALQNLVTAIEHGIISNTTNKRLHELEDKKTELERQILIEKSKSTVLLTEEQIRKFYSAALTLEPQALIDTVVKEIVVYDDKVQIHCKSPFELSPDRYSGQGFIVYTETTKKSFKNPHRAARTVIRLAVTIIM